ncbi:rna-directed dna polymerase from mobile element jockey-like [Pitangus sulphuratus]|nr:rna-directed dna polymerase from mobile element jockey-like [Pitangus sulphuratus]
MASSCARGDSEHEKQFSKFANDIRLCGEVNKHVLNRLERWVCVKLIKFNKAKCKVLQVDQGNPKHKYRLGREQIKTGSEEKDFRVLFDKKLNKTQQCVFAAQKANHVLGCLKRSVTRRSREMRPHLEYCVQL